MVRNDPMPWIDSGRRTGRNTAYPFKLRMLRKAERGRAGVERFNGLEVWTEKIQHIRTTDDEIVP
jgi:hypothetical protein